jgi:hypothetical protein
LVIDLTWCEEKVQWKRVGILLEKEDSKRSVKRGLVTSDRGMGRLAGSIGEKAEGCGAGVLNKKSLSWR